MRVKSLKKLHLRGTICKKKKKVEEKQGYCTINMFSQINGATKPLASN